METTYNRVMKGLGFLLLIGIVKNENGKKLPVMGFYRV